MNDWITKLGISAEPVLVLFSLLQNSVWRPDKTDILAVPFVGAIRNLGILKIHWFGWRSLSLHSLRQYLVFGAFSCG